MYLQSRCTNIQWHNTVICFKGRNIYDNTIEYMSHTFLYTYIYFRGNIEYVYMSFYVIQYSCQNIKRVDLHDSMSCAPRHLRPSQMRPTSTAPELTVPHIKIQMCRVYDIRSTISVVNVSIYGRGWGGADDGAQKTQQDGLTVSQMMRTHKFHFFLTMYN
jgi:hypothetical protein